MEKVKHYSQENFNIDIGNWLVDSSAIGTFRSPTGNSKVLGISQTLMHGQWQLMKVGCGPWTEQAMQKSKNYLRLRRALQNSSAPTNLLSNPVFLMIVNCFIKAGVAKDISKDFALSKDEIYEILDDLNNYQGFYLDTPESWVRDVSNIFNSTTFNLDELYFCLNEGANWLMEDPAITNFQLSRWNIWLDVNFHHIETIAREFLLNNTKIINFRYNSFNFI